MKMERMIAAALVGVCVLIAAMVVPSGAGAFGGPSTGPEWRTVETPEPLPALMRPADATAAPVAASATTPNTPAVGEFTPPPPFEYVDPSPASPRAPAEFASYQPNRAEAATVATLNALAARVSKLETDVAALAPRSKSTPTPSPAPVVETVYQSPAILYSEPVPVGGSFVTYASGSNCSGGVCRPATAAPRRGLFRRW